MLRTCCWRRPSCPPSTSWTCLSQCSLRSSMFLRCRCALIGQSQSHLCPPQVFPVRSNPPADALGTYLARGAACHHGSISHHFFGNSPGYHQVTEGSQQAPSIQSEYGVSVVTVITVSVHSSISPLKFCCDFRPYFTIHDSEFREYTTRTQAP